MVEGGMSVVKYLVFAFNFIFFLFGAGLLGLGIYVQIELSKYLNFFEAPVNAPAIVLIVVGAITLIVGFCGCCGAIKEHYCLLMTFAVLIGIIFVIELGGGIAGYVLKGQVNDFVTKGMMKAMRNYETAQGVKDTWMNAQHTLRCCGVHNASDWAREVPAQFSDGTLPDSCCPQETRNCSTTSPGHYTKGCLQKIEDTVLDNVGYAAAVAVAFAVIELTGIILACCLGRSVKSEYEIA